MPIVSSTYVMDSHTQANGSRWVRETHVDNTGREFRGAPYRLPAGEGGIEAQARLTTNAAHLSAMVAEMEAGEILGS